MDPRDRDLLNPDGTFNEARAIYELDLLVSEAGIEPEGEEHGPPHIKHWHWQPNEEQVIQVEALAAVCTLKQIAAYWGIPSGSLVRAMKKNLDLYVRYKKGKAKAHLIVAKSLMQKAVDGDVNAAKFFLQCQSGWQDRPAPQVITNQYFEAPQLADREERIKRIEELFGKVIEPRKTAALPEWQQKDAPEPAPKPKKRGRPKGSKTKKGKAEK